MSEHTPAITSNLMSDVLAFLKTQQRAEEIALAALRKAGEGYLDGEPMKAYNERVRLIEQLEILSGNSSAPETSPPYPQIITDRLRQIANLIDSRPVAGHWPAMMAQPDADFLRSLSSALQERRPFVHSLLTGSPEETSRKLPPREFDVESHQGLYAEKAVVWPECIEGNCCPYPGCHLPMWTRHHYHAGSESMQMVETHLSSDAKAIHDGPIIDCEVCSPKASEQECRRSGLSDDAAGTGTAEPRAEARLSRREVTAQKASEARCTYWRSGEHKFEEKWATTCKCGAQKASGGPKLGDPHPPSCACWDCNK